MSAAIIFSQEDLDIQLQLVAGSAMCLFLTVPWVGLQCVIVVFSGHTHLCLGHFIYITIKIDQLFRVSCRVIIHSWQLEVNYFIIIIAIANLFK